MGLGLSRLREKGGRKLDVMIGKFVSQSPITFETNNGEEKTLTRIDIQRARYTPRTRNAEADIRALIMGQDARGNFLLRNNEINLYAGNTRIPLTAVANTPDYGGQYVIGQTRTGGGGVGTETWSEILAMYCVAYYVKYNRIITREQFTSDGDLVSSVYPSVSRICHVPSSQVSFSSARDRANLVNFALSALSGIRGSTWLDCAIAQSEILSERLSIGRSCHVFSDKFFGRGTGRYDPYKIFLQVGNTAETDKWNPADMWIMNQKGMQNIRRFNTKFFRTASVVALNDFLIYQYNKGNIFPISLKKLNPASPHFALMNSNEFVERIDVSNQNSPAIIEFTRGNRDMKINFTLETVRLAKGRTAKNAQENLFRGGDGGPGQVVPNSQKRIRIKFKTSTRGLELEYSQSKGATLPAAKNAEAKMGALGKNEYNRIISGSTNEGVNRLNQLKQNYDNTNLELSTSVSDFTSHNLRIGPQNQTLAEQYLDLIFREINGVPHDDVTYLSNTDAIKDKIIAGEIGVSIDKISNSRVKRRVIQNLYNACASVGIMVGLNAEERQIESATSVQTGRLRPDFVGGIHAKVY